MWASQNAATEALLQPVAAGANSVEALLHELEESWLDTETADVTTLALMLERRQLVLDRLSAIDQTSLDSVTRQRFDARILAVHARDQELLEAVRRQAAGLNEVLDGILQGRAVARAYGHGGYEEARIMKRSL